MDTETPGKCLPDIIPLITQYYSINGIMADMNKFKDALTKQIFDGTLVKSFPPAILRRAVIKLTMSEAATAIRELATPPSNHFEKLKGSRTDQWSIRVNDQYRICFKFIDVTDHPRLNSCLRRRCLAFGTVFRYQRTVLA